MTLQTKQQIHNIPSPAVCANEGWGHLGRHWTEAVALLQGTGSCRICQSPTRSTIEYVKTVHLIGYRTRTHTRRHDITGHRTQWRLAYFQNLVINWVQSFLLCVCLTFGVLALVREEVGLDVGVREPTLVSGS